MLLLCIDDDPDDLEVFCEAVKTINAAYRCVVAENGAVALTMLDDLRPDLIFLDINMPVLDGKQTLQRIRRDSRFTSIPVCIYSTSASPREIDTFRKLGADEWLTKPTTFDDLCNSLRLLFASRS